MGWLATDKQHVKYAICSVITSQKAYVYEPVMQNILTPKTRRLRRALKNIKNKEKKWKKIKKI